MTSLTQQFVEADDATLEILRGGAGHPIVCCQYPHSSEWRTDQWYADHTELIYVVVRGLGKSSPIGELHDLTYLQAAHDPEAVRRELGIERWVVQGNSAGSQVALRYAISFPDSLAGLIVGAGFPSSSRLLANPRSMCCPEHPDHQADLEAVWGREVQHLPAVISSPEHYGVQLGPQVWGFFRGDTPLIR